MLDSSNLPGRPSFAHKLLVPARTLCAAIGFLFLVVTLTPVTRWCSASLAGTLPAASSDGAVLIVLAGSVLSDGTMGGSSYWRAVYASRIWKSGRYGRVLVCGGGSDGAPVAVAIRDYMISQGVPADEILIETQSRNTRENALYARPFLDALPGKKVLLTSDYHMYRAQRAFARAGIQTEPAPIPDVYKLSLRLESRWSAFLELCEEFVKIGYYRARGWI
jgi:uncharacterized SAM-binding protein YcdF (DUF218 family)